MFLFWIHLLTWSGFAYINTHTHTVHKQMQTYFIHPHNAAWSQMIVSFIWQLSQLLGHTAWAFRLANKIILQTMLFSTPTHNTAIVFSPVFFSSLGLAFFYDDFNIVNDSNDGNKNKKGMLCREKFIHLFYFILASSSTITTWLSYWWICIW